MKKFLRSLLSLLLIVNIHLAYAQAPSISYSGPQSYPVGFAIKPLLPQNSGGRIAVYDARSLSYAGVSPASVAVDSTGNMYIWDATNYVIKKVSTTGVVSTLAGSGSKGISEGRGTAASFSEIRDIAIDATGNLFVTDGNRIRKITQEGEVTTFAGTITPDFKNGAAIDSRFRDPQGLAFDQAGNLYVADGHNHRIRKITPAGVVSTFAGSGVYHIMLDATGTTATFNFPRGIDFDANGNLYVADAFNHRIRKISPAGVVSTIAGNGLQGVANGTGAAARFRTPSYLVVDSLGDIYVAETPGSFSFNSTTRKITPEGVVSTFGSGSPKLGLALNRQGNLLITSIEQTYFYLTEVLISPPVTVSPSLPPGLVLDPGTGIISGTPTLATGPTTHTITARNLSGASTTNLTISTVVGPPVITSFTPAMTGIKGMVTINGYNFTGATALTLGGVSPFYFDVVSDTQINARVGEGATSGNVTVTTSYGTVSSQGLTIQPPPNISSNKNSYTFYKGVATTPVFAVKNLGSAVPNIAYAQVSTLAGNRNRNWVDGTGTSASFFSPSSLVSDASGNLYVTDQDIRRIRKITPSGVVSTFAGGGTLFADGAGMQAGFYSPSNITIDALGNLFVSDGYKIRRITPAGVVSTFAGNDVAGAVDGTGTEAQFSQLGGLAFDRMENLYVIDKNRIRKISREGVVTTLKEPGGAELMFGLATGIIVDHSGNLIVSDYQNNVIWKVTPSGIKTILAGTGTQVSVSKPSDLTIDNQGNIYFVDGPYDVIRRISPSGVMTTIAGNNTNDNIGYLDGIGATAHFNGIEGIALDHQGNLYAADRYNYLIRKISLTGYTISPDLPAGLSFDSARGAISGTPTVLSPPSNHIITAHNQYGSSETTITLSVVEPLNNIFYTGPQIYATGVPITPLSPVITGAENTGDAIIIAGSSTQGFTNGPVATATFQSVRSAVVDAMGNIYVVDAGNYAIRKISPDGVVSTFAGNGTQGTSEGTGTAARFSDLRYIAIDASGNLFVTDGNRIRKITPAGVVSTFAGTVTPDFKNSIGTDSRFRDPQGLAFDNAGNLYVADGHNHRIRKITPAGGVSTFAGSGTYHNFTDGTGTTATFNFPKGLAFDANGNLYVADAHNHRIRKITPAGVVSTVAGNGLEGAADGTGAAARFRTPSGLVVDGMGEIYVADLLNDKIRRITPEGVVSTLAPSPRPNGLAVDGQGNLIVAGLNDPVIRKFMLRGFSISPSLPPGLVFDKVTGIISGTPTSVTGPTTYTITANNQFGASTASLTISTIQGGPAITAFTPSIAGIGSFITITGSNFTGATGVTIGGISASSFDIVSDTKIVARVAEGAKSGSVTVTTPEGTATQPGITVQPPPQIAGNGPFLFYTGVPVTQVFATTNSGSAVPNTAAYGQVSTFAGGGLGTQTDGTITSATFASPNSLVFDSLGNLYVVDWRLIRKITPSGVVSTLAGSALRSDQVDGTGTQAGFSSPRSITIDAIGNLFVTDEYKIRRITPTGVVSTIAGRNVAGVADGTGSEAGFTELRGLAFDSKGDLYAIDRNRIRKISPGGVVTTLKDPGGADVTVGDAAGIIVDHSGNIVVSDQNNNRIWKVSPSGIKTLLAGTGTQSSVSKPSDLAIDNHGNIYFVDSYYSTIRRISPSGIITPIAGNNNDWGYSDGIGALARFYIVLGLAVDHQGNLYAADNVSHRIRKISLAGYAITPDLPAGLVFDGARGIISGTPRFVTTPSSYTIRAYNQFGSSETTVSISVVDPLPGISYNGPQIYSKGVPITPLSPVKTGGGVNTGQAMIIAGSSTQGFTNGPVTIATFRPVRSAAVDATGNIYVLDAGNYAIRKISPDGLVSTFAGNGTQGFNDGAGTAARFTDLRYIAIDASGNLFVTDGNRIRKITPAGVVSAFAGMPNADYKDGTAIDSRFRDPQGLAFDRAGNLYVADGFNHRIRKITPAGMVSTFAGSGVYHNVVDGTGTTATFNFPKGIDFDANGNLYVADAHNHRIRKITPAGVVSTVAGNGSEGAADGTGVAASFRTPSGLVVDSSGEIYVADLLNNKIRRITTEGMVKTFADSPRPNGLALDRQGNLIVAGLSDPIIRKYLLSVFSISPSLPPGLVLDKVTGIISGTPTEESPATTYTITVSNSSGSNSANLTISVDSSFPTTAAANPAAGMIKAEPKLNLSEKAVVYPNPFNRTLNVLLANQDENKASVITISTLDGKIVFVRESKVKNIELDLPTLIPGYYILRLNIGNSSSYFRILKE